jgi:hypothetical protein
VGRRRYTNLETGPQNISTDKILYDPVLSNN